MGCGTWLEQLLAGGERADAAVARCATGTTGTNRNVVAHPGSIRMPDAAARAQCGHGAQSDWDVLTIARLFGELQNGPAALLWAAEARAFAAPPSPLGI
mmetsp:Transcript_7746/g.18391  ORF Transcript_7746/g.18391 Transcript_7746/m.18391 type:complete len:99 (-) Transcript_7746:184-480(-)